MSHETLTPGGAMVITGASSGIGRATAERFAAQGVPLYLLARRQAPLQALVDELTQRHPEGEFIAIAGDLAAHEERDRVIQMLTQAFDKRNLPPGAFVHCAGIGTPAADLAHWDPDDLNAALQLNVVAPLALIRALMPHLERRYPPCRIVLVGAGIDRHAQPGTGTYGVSKMALRRLFEQLTLDLTPYAASVALFQPGLADTPGLRDHLNVAAELSLPHAQYLQQRLDQGHYLTADSVGIALVSLLSDIPSEHFNGQEWHATQLLE
ncbi:SDR family NAD(P)-dependent oxidoreductase [Halomonas vilamensis]|uniref:SDR family NAD(P)-dependent oxidoreductase n=1 Tax=Vreelandella vilamensis TaxID=531309 RepID=A0ABU1H170_9GAMM|nr:SDR family oxidoreductase [Halomonas vilamensis]MDR5897561.1 SDR family NAD(P)-dependent oxidoreductase [Halomonas vilamensis]